VDADQFAEAPGHVLTSMIKRVDQVVFDQIDRVRTGTFRGGVYEYGLAEGGIGYVYDANNRAMIPDSVHARLNTLASEITAGKIIVPVSR
jgi:basic membrane protein A